MRGGGGGGGGGDYINTVRLANSLTSSYSCYPINIIAIIQFVKL